MTPKACSLYDWIKLYKLKNGCFPRIGELPKESRVVVVEELVKHKWIKLVNIEFVWEVQLLR